MEFSSFELVTAEQLEGLADSMPRTVDARGELQAGRQFDITGWMADHFPEAAEKSWRGRVLWELPECPFNPEHQRTARITRLENGALSFGCFHNSCQDKGWHELRALKEPDAVREGKDKTRSEGIRVPELVRMSDVEPEDVQWLWEPYIPAGKITLMEGDPGDGKTWVAIQIAACVSAGYPLPDPATGRSEIKMEPGSVIYMTAEDGLADTIRPRLDAAGADSTRVYMLTGSRDEEGRLQGVTLSDIRIIEQAIQELKPCLMVADPIQAYLGSKVDMHRANETRPLLSELAKVAEKHGVAVICIRHLSKAKTSRQVYRGIGSIDFAAAARSVLLVGKDPETPVDRAIVQVKSSLAQMGPAMGFKIEHSQFSWTGLSNLTAGRLMGDEPDDKERTAVDSASDFLTEMLAGGPVTSESLFAEAKKQGISKASLRRAKKSLGITSYKTQGLGSDAPWCWAMPVEDDQEDDQVH